MDSFTRSFLSSRVIGGWRAGRACRSVGPGGWPAGKSVLISRVAVAVASQVTVAAPIDLVLFDLGGVLIDPGGVGPMRELSGLSTDEEVWARWLRLPLGAPLRGRAVHARGVRSRGGRRLGARARAGGVPRRVRRLAGPPLPRRPGAGAEVQARVPVGFLSNMNALQWEANYEGIPLTDAFAHRFLSFELGMVKPDRAIFDVVAALGCRSRVSGCCSSTTTPSTSRRRRGGIRGRACHGASTAPGPRWSVPGCCPSERPGAAGRVRRGPDGAPGRAACANMPRMVANGPMLRLLPRLSDDVAFFWTSGEDGVLRFLRCNTCGFFIHPPGPVCPRCLSRDLGPQAVSGRGHVETFTVNYQQWIPGSDPYIIAWVSIDEQPDVRLTTNLVDVEPDDVRIGMPVRVVFEHVEDVWLPLFTPGGGVVSPRPPARSRWSAGPSSRASASPTSDAGSGAPTST